MFESPTLCVCLTNFVHCLPAKRCQYGPNKCYGWIVSCMQMCYEHFGQRLWRERRSRAGFVFTVILHHPWPRCHQWHPVTPGEHSESFQCTKDNGKTMLDCDQSRSCTVVQNVRKGRFAHDCIFNIKHLDFTPNNDCSCPNYYSRGTHMFVRTSCSSLLFVSYGWLISNWSVLGFRIKMTWAMMWGPSSFFGRYMTQCSLGVVLVIFWWKLYI